MLIIICNTLAFQLISKFNFLLNSVSQTLSPYTLHLQPISLFDGPIVKVSSKMSIGRNLLTMRYKINKIFFTLTLFEIFIFIKNITYCICSEILFAASVQYISVDKR